MKHFKFYYRDTFNVAYVPDNVRVRYFSSTPDSDHLYLDFNDGRGYVPIEDCLDRLAWEPLKYKKSVYCTEVQFAFIKQLLFSLRTLDKGSSFSMTLDYNGCEVSLVGKTSEDE